MPPTIDTAALRQEFATVRTAALALVDTAAAEGREFTDAERAEQDGREKRLKSIQSILDQHAKFATFAIDPASNAGNEPAPAANPANPNPPGEREYSESRGEIRITREEGFRKELSRAFSAWGATGNMDQRFATITTATQSGALLPRMVTTPISASAANAFREAISINGMDAMSIVTTQTTAAMNVPVMDPAAGGSVAENASSETTNSPALTESITLNPTTYQSGTAYLSNQVLLANDYDLVGQLVPQLEYSKELGLESAIAAAIIADSGITQTVVSATTTGYTYAKLADLNRALPKRYDRSKAMILSRDAFAYAEKLTDSQGRPILTPDAQDQSLLRFNGTPVVRSDYFQDLTANHVIGCVVSCLGFRIRDAATPTLARYTQVPSKPNQTGFNLFGYHAYGYALSAIATFKTAVS